MIHAGVYSATLHYLKAVEALKGDDGTKVIAKMKETPTDDPLFGKGTIRADGRKLHPMYLFEVKKPSESKGPWDYYKTRATIAGRAGVPADRPGGLPPGEEVEARLLTLPSPQGGEGRRTPSPGHGERAG